MSLRLTLAEPLHEDPANLSISSIACVSTEHILAALTNGTLASFTLNKEGRQTGVQFYQLLRSRQPFPTNATGVVPIHAAWGNISITRRPSPSGDNVEFVFSFQGGNKIYRTSLPPRSLVEGFFGGAPVETFASQKEAVSCVAVSKLTESHHGVLGTGSVDGVAMVWNLAHSVGDRGDPNILTVGAHASSPVHSMTFPTGNHVVVTASNDQAVRVWRVADGTLLQSLATGNVPVNVIACRDEGTSLMQGWTETTVVAGTSTGSVFCWKLTHEEATTSPEDRPIFMKVNSSANAVGGGGGGGGGSSPAMTTQHHLVAMSDHSAHAIVHLDVDRPDRTILVGGADGLIRHYKLGTRVFFLFFFFVVGIFVFTCATCANAFISHPTRSLLFRFTKR